MEFQNFKLLGASCIEEKGICMLIGVRNYLSNEWVEVAIPRENFTPQELYKHALKNGSLCPNKNAIAKGLLKQFDKLLVNGELKVKNYHRNLGWILKGDKIAFLGNECISKDATKSSSYMGDLEIAPKGEMGAVSRMITEQIVAQEEWSPMEAIVAFGVGATVLAYANVAWGECLNNLMMHLMGDSSTGKSTSLALFVGLGSNPNPKRGFWINYSSSDASIVKRIGNNYGFPVALDELSCGNTKGYSELVYTIGNGEEKDRLTAGGVGFQESAVFQTVVLSSGEVSIIKKCANTSGIRARCIEFANVCWTKSKEQSNIIKKCMKENSALITPMIAQELIGHNDTWKARWDYWKQKVEDFIEKERVKLSVSHRISDYVSLFAFSAEIANKVMNVELNVDRIFKFCYEYIIIANEEDGNLGERAYSALVNYISLYKENFDDATYYSGCRTQFNDIVLPMNSDGFFYHPRKKIIEEKNYDTLFVFRPGVAEKVLADAGFSDGKVALFQLREAGYLKIKDKKRNTYTYTINGSPQNCVAIYFSDETMEGEGIDDEFD